MSTGPGNDPFSGSDIQNVLQHMISPKIVSDGVTGYVVKSDLINVDNLYLTGNVYSNGTQINTPYISVKSNAQGGEVAIGEGSGQTSQGNYCVAIGPNAAQTTQSDYAIAIGLNTGQTSQGNRSIAIGNSSGNVSQGSDAVAIGNTAAINSQGASSIAIGKYAGTSNLVSSSSTAQAANSIILNATGSFLSNVTASSCVIKPIRGDTTSNLTGAGFKQLYYNPTTGELCYTTS
jgi:hypothetical protein